MSVQAKQRQQRHPTNHHHHSDLLKGTKEGGEVSGEKSPKQHNFGWIGVDWLGRTPAD